ncbi:MAG: antitoxin [Elusimicrobia bacterium]|nr:antitoxin [Elusimicrobiota bacterium]
MKKAGLTKEERRIERELLRGEYRPVSRAEFDRIAKAIARRRKDAVLNIRVNSEDLAGIKEKARTAGVPYQTFVSELIHRYAA